MKVKVYIEFPAELETIQVEKLHELLGGPSLFHIKGEKSEPLFISALLHGNERSSFSVVQRLIKKYKEASFPRDLVLFIGNTEAAQEGLRQMPGRADFNRIWEEGDTEEHEISKFVMDYTRKLNLFASIDIHNNTGKNPTYSCINVLSKKFVELASNFGKHTVYFTEPHNVQSMAFSKFCTSMTIEAGLSGNVVGIEKAFELVDYILCTDEISLSEKRADQEIYHTFARIKVAQTAKIDFKNTLSADLDLSFIPELDENNFEFIPKGTPLGMAYNLDKLRVVDDFEKDITDDFFEIKENYIITKRLFIPSMFTKDERVMKDDCLGYIMEVIKGNH